MVPSQSYRNFNNKFAWPFKVGIDTVIKIRQKQLNDKPVNLEQGGWVFLTQCKDLNPRFISPSDEMFKTSWTEKRQSTPG